MEALIQVGNISSASDATEETNENSPPVGGRQLDHLLQAREGAGDRSCDAVALGRAFSDCEAQVVARAGLDTARSLRPRT